MSCSDVCVEMDYDGSSEFSSRSTRRAAKPYRCDECRGEIAKGESHEYLVGKCEGDFFSARTCSVCAELRNEFCCGAWVIGELWESIREQLFPKWHDMKVIDCVLKLTEPAQAKLRAEYAQYAKDQDL